MSITLYELVGDGDRRFSPYCWRTRFALAHKGLEADRIAVKFTDKDKIAFSGQKLVPILQDGDTTVSDSWTIACYLEDAYPDQPSLFGGAMGRAEARFINVWADRSMNLSIFPLIVQDIYAHVHPDDRAYFLETRGSRFDKPFAEVQKGRDDRVDAVRAGLAPLRATLEEQPYLCGDAPAYADYAVFGGFQWARSVSPFALLATDDPICDWRRRMLDSFDGLAQEAVAYEV